MKMIFLTTAALAFAAQALGGEVRSEGRAFTHSCGYFSNTEADVWVFYRDRGLPLGTEVELISGLDGYEYKMRDGNQVQARVAWRDRRISKMRAVSPHVWRGDVSFVLAERSYPWRYEGLDFVFQIRLPDGRSYYDNGGRGTRGYYLARLQEPYPCVDADRAKPPLGPLETRIVEKN